jgi:transposase
MTLKFKVGLANVMLSTLSSACLMLTVEIMAILQSRQDKALGQFIQEDRVLDYSIHLKQMQFKDYKNNYGQTFMCKMD